MHEMLIAILALSVGLMFGFGFGYTRIKDGVTDFLTHLRELESEGVIKTETVARYVESQILQEEAKVKGILRDAMNVFRGNKPEATAAAAPDLPRSDVQAAQS